MKFIKTFFLLLLVNISVEAIGATAAAHDEGAGSRPASQAASRKPSATGRRRGRRRSTTTTTTTTTTTEVPPTELPVAAKLIGRSLNDQDQSPSDQQDLSKVIPESVFVARRKELNRKLTRNGKVIDCSEERRVAVSKLMMSALIMGDEDLRPPEDVAALLSWCATTRESLNAAIQYSHDCYAGISQQISLVLLKSGKAMLRTRCRDKANFKDLIDHFSCFKTDRARELHRCMTSQTLKLHWISRTRELPADYLIPGMCCTVPQVSECVRKTALSVCAGVVPRLEETVDFYTDFVETLTGDAMELFCGRFGNPETCSAVLPKAATAFTRIDRDVRAGNYSRLATGNAIVIPLIDIFDREDFDKDD